MSTPPAPLFLSHPAVRRHFDRIAPQYGQGDFLAREIDQRMLERLDYVKISPSHALDVGCGLGASLPALQQRYPQTKWIGVDASAGMLCQASQLQGLRPNRWRKLWQQTLGQKVGQNKHLPSLLNADAAALPLAAQSCGLYWANLLLPWVNDPLPVLQEARRVLEVGGLLMFSTFGPDTLKELRAAFADGQIHTQRFFDMHDLGDMLASNGFADPVMDMEILTLTYNDLDTLLRELRLSGSQCLMHDRPKGLMGKHAAQTFRQRYAALAQTHPEHRLPATFEIIYGHAWKAQPKTTAEGEAIVRFMGRG